MSKRPPLDSTPPLTKDYSITNVDNLLVNCFGSALLDLMFNMQHEILANILLHQHNLIYNNSNIVFATSKVHNTTNFISNLNFLQVSIFLFDQANTSPCSSNATATPIGAGDVNTRQSTSGSLVTILKNNMHSNSKTQQVIATSSAEAELYAISSTIADAIHLKQLITEIENNISVATFDLDKHQPNIVLFCDSSSATSLVQLMGISKRTKHIQLHFLWIQDLHQSGQLVLRRVSAV